MGRPRHPDKHIEKAIRYAEAQGWSVAISNGHTWGRIRCPLASREGCIVSIWSTPKNAENHARHIRREVDICPHSGGGHSEQDPDTGDPDGSQEVV